MMVCACSEFHFSLYAVRAEPLDDLLSKLREMQRVAEDLTRLGLDVRMDLTAEDGGKVGVLRLIGTPKTR